MDRCEKLKKAGVNILAAVNGRCQIPDEMEDMLAQGNTDLIAGARLFLADHDFKDVVDLYCNSKVFAFDKSALIGALQNSGRELDSFHGFLYRVEELRHSYEKFRFAGDIEKPSFDEVYDTVKTYVKDVLPKDGTL